jgi:transketolase
VVDHHTYVFLGDGCLMEGISHEACSLAGVWKLGKLIALYDDNGISIDGAVQSWFGDDTPARFRAYGWNVIGPVDGHDVARSGRSHRPGQGRCRRPTLIVCRTTIGKGSPGRAGTARAHGEPLGADEIARHAEALGWPHEPFEVPPALAWGTRAPAACAGSRVAPRFEPTAAHPALAAEFERRMSGELPEDFADLQRDVLSLFARTRDAVATRKASQNVLEALAPRMPELLGGSADLTGSNLTDFRDCGAVRAGQPGGHMSTTACASSAWPRS